MAEVMDEKETYRTHFAAFEKRLNGARNSHVHQIRRRAIERFAERGFPTTREEDWRYTSLVPLARIRFHRARPLELDKSSRESVEGKLLLQRAGLRLVFVNGRYAPDLSRPAPSPDKMTIGSLETALQTQPEFLEEHLARYASYEDSPLVALNTTFIQDGAFIHIPDGTAVEEPIHLVFLSASSGEPTVSHPRNLIVAGKNSRATIMETYQALGEDVYFTNAVTEVVACENAVVDHYRLQRESEQSFHMGNVTAYQNRDSAFSSHVISLGGALVRNDVGVVLDGEGSRCALNGLYVVNGRQHVDNHTVIDHARPHCSSKETYKGVLDGKSRAVFNGEIVVRKDAQKTDARQINKNLVLSEDARINTKPRLRINADDVKCTHGATVGMLDEDALFYLRSRGFHEEDARKILTHAFVSDVLDLIKTEPLRTELDKLVLARLPAGERIKELA